MAARLFQSTFEAARGGPVHIAGTWTADQLTGRNDHVGTLAQKTTSPTL